VFKDHFGLEADPFLLSPNLKYYFPSRAQEETMAHLAYGLEQGEDFILITGAIGTGKTLALHNLLSQLSAGFRTVLINVTQITYREFLKLVVNDLEPPVAPEADIADLLGSLKKHLLEAQRRGQKILLIIDEAQNLDQATLEGARLLTNLVQERGQCLQIVLAGQPPLEAKVRLPELAQLRQRIRIHYRLEPLHRDELENYINHRVGVAGCDRRLFHAKALDKIYEVSGGVPRLVNVVAGRSLLAAFVAGRNTIKANHVDVEDLAPIPPDLAEVQEGPPPRLEPTGPVEPASPVEPAGPVEPDLPALPPAVSEPVPGGSAPFVPFLVPHPPPATSPAPGGDVQAPAARAVPDREPIGQPEPETGPISEPAGGPVPDPVPEPDPEPAAESATEPAAKRVASGSEARAGIGATADAGPGGDGGDSPPVQEDVPVPWDEPTALRESLRGAEPADPQDPDDEGIDLDALFRPQPDRPEPEETVARSGSSPSCWPWSW